MPQFSLSPSLGALAILFLCTPCIGQQDDNAGIGTIKRGFDASNLTPGRDVILAGVTYLNGKTYVSGSGNGPMVYEFDSTGALTNSFVPPAQLGGMATDGASLMGATAGGVFVFDTNGGLVGNVIAANGPQPVANPIPSLSVRAVEFDPNGNGGNGSLFIGNIGAIAPIQEIDLAGNILNSFPNLGWDCSGLALDAKTGNLWCLNRPGSSDIIELDRMNALNPTGVSFRQGNPSIAFQGDLAAIAGGDPATYASEFDVVVLDRLDGPDWLYYHRVHLYPNLLGTKEAFLEGSINANPMAKGDLGIIAANDTLNWQINPGNSVATGFPALIIFNIGRDAAFDGVTRVPFLPGFPPFAELRGIWPLSVPSSPLGLLLDSSVGGPVTSVTLPPGVLGCFNLVRMQGVYLEPTAPIQFPLVATNEIWTNVADEATCNIVVEAVGANSFNADPTSGFWRVLHMGGPAILDITFDWQSGTNIGQGSMRFDTDNPNMADFFDAGNSAVVGCGGTYRNGSDATVGLVYDPLNNPPNLCDPTANTGWIGTVEGVNPLDWRVLMFRFANFAGGTPGTPVVFEFDCDTDGGLGTDGASMAGCVIWITLSDGRSLGSELHVDLNTPLRSVAGFR